MEEADAKKNYKDNKHQKCSESTPEMDSEHVIPTMIITSADDTCEEAVDDQNASTQKSEVEPVSENVSVQDSGIMAEIVEECANERVEKIQDSALDSIAEAESADSVIYSAAQRPLMIEQDKGAPVSGIVQAAKETNDDDEQQILTSIPSQQVLPRTMQRPLIFDSTMFQNENIIIVQDETLPESLVTSTIEERSSEPFKEECKIEEKSSECPEESSCSDKQDQQVIQSELSAETNDFEEKSKYDDQKLKSVETPDHSKKDGAFHGVKKFIDSFLHDGSSKPTSSQNVNKNDDSHIDEKKTTKETKHSIKKLFSSSKVEHGNASKRDESLDSGKEAAKPKLKDSKLGVKKFFDSFKSDSHIIQNRTDEASKNIDKDGVRKRSNSLKESTLTRNSAKAEGKTMKGQKETFHGVRKFFDAFMHGETDASCKLDKSDKKRSSSIRRSQSYREATTSTTNKEPHGLKSFLDSLAHKSRAKPSASHTPQPPQDIDTQDDNHIYDIVEKPKEDTPMAVKPKESKTKGHGVQKLLGSILHKSHDKPKEKQVDKMPKIADVINNKEKEIIIDQNHAMDSHEKELAKDMLDEKQVTCKNEEEKVRDTYIEEHDKELIGDTSEELQVRDTDCKTHIRSSELNTEADLTLKYYSSELHENELENEIAAPISQKSTDHKTSIFDSLNENLSAIKDKVLHHRESKKSCIKLAEEDAFQEYDLQNLPSSSEFSTQVAGSYKPIKDNFKVDANKNIEMEKLKTNPESILSSASCTGEVTTTAYNGKESGRPDTLYDTCCFQLAVLLRNKALEKVSPQSKTPPAKPPKPSAQAVAKARATMVSKRLKELGKGKSVGENIPVGYDGIRFADDETESSCDYKDLDNYDYIMDYELINRYKFDKDVFSDPSTGSGRTSYYTADTDVTLKDDAYSDAQMETVSLGSHENLSDKDITSSSQFTYQVKEIIPLNKLDKTKSHQFRKVPPPLPPKPDAAKISALKKGNLANNSKEYDSSSILNGLSLSPRNQSKFAKDDTAIQHRPLLVADIKGTEFSSLPSRTHRKKNIERTFNTVLTNESLKSISTLSSVRHPPLKSVKSSPTNLDSNSSSKPIKKITPQRPPPPTSPKSSILTDGQNSVDCEQHKPEKSISPPRPPPPIKIYHPSPPPRPPLPVTKRSTQKAAKTSEKHINFEGLEKSPKLKRVTCKMIEIEEPRPKSPELETLKKIPIFNPQEGTSMQESAVIHANAMQNIENKQCITGELQKHTSDLIFSNSSVANSINFNFEVESFPKPPPRTRRVRSRTADSVSKEKTPDNNLRRSQSLSDLDIHKNTMLLTPNNSAVKPDFKHIYTSVNKNKKSVLVESSSLERLSDRPLPAPPPPPRKFRSLERKPKETEDAKDIPEINGSYSLHNELSTSVPNCNIKPPSRKKKGDQNKFRSHSTGIKTTVHDSLPKPRSSSAPVRPAPAPPERKLRHSGHNNPNISPRYDQNGNISFPVTVEVHDNPVMLDECGNEILLVPGHTDIPHSDASDSIVRNATNVVPHLRDKKERSSTEKSHASWYDESPSKDEPWEMLDWDSKAEAESKFIIHPKMLMRRRSEPIQKTRTSKFYVDIDMQVERPTTPLVDKETSPLHLDCSEKSVQTSLETLSQAVTSCDEQEEKTDKLLDLTQTLQNQLESVLNRHKSPSESNGDSYTPQASDSDRNVHDSHRKVKKTPSIMSSNSEMWPLTSSEESDVDLAAENQANLTEVAQKRKQRKIFYIAQEIMTSEEAFVDALKLLNVEFRAAVTDASQQRSTVVLPDEILSQILNHLPQLQHLNENLLMELKDRIENWDKVGKIADIMVKVGPFLKLYSWFIQDFESNISLFEESKKKYPLFAQVVKDFEATPRCKRLALNHFMLKPIQRIPQYRLLLQEYHHHLTEDSPDFQDTVSALQIVCEVANHANDSMKQGDNALKLISIQNSILGHKEIIKPGRLFLKEGELMKLSRKGMQPRRFVLFNDILLYLTPVQQGLYRVNHELPLTGMKVAIPVQQDYQNEFSIITISRSFTLAARSPEERKEWIIDLTKAIEENASKRSTFTNIRLMQKVQSKISEEDDGTFVLGKRAPVWIPDARVTMCQLCTSEFTVTFRRHHCRACGKVVCSICSSNKVSLPYLNNTMARVCDECYPTVRPGFNNQTESAETDSDSQQVGVKIHSRAENRHVKKGRRNLPSVLKEVCANDQGSTISGYLQKRWGKTWKREWFVVKDKVLYEYKASEDVAALRSTPLLGYQIETFSEPFENVDHSLVFQLTHPGQTPIVFHADSVGSTERWIAALKEASVLE